MLNTESVSPLTDAKALDLALLALDELANKKTSKILSYRIADVQKFCDAIIDKDDNLQIQMLEELINKGTSMKVLYEEFLPESAETLGNLWKESKLTFVEVNLGAQRLQRLARIYENRYLGPFCMFGAGLDILLILPEGEIHTLGLITASGIFKKNNANPFIAVGYKLHELENLINERDFRLIGLSLSNSKNISSCIAIAKQVRKSAKGNVPIILGGQGIRTLNSKIDLQIFDLITQSPRDALHLITNNDNN